MATHTQIFELKIPYRHFKWVDITHPTKKHLEEVAKEYNILPKYVKECLEPEHLPKIEKIGPTTMIVLRAYDEQGTDASMTIQDLTRKIIIFYNEKFLLTLHRRDQPLLKHVRDKWALMKEEEKSSDHQLHPEMIIHDLLEEIINSYQIPLESGFEKLEQFEMRLVQELPSEFELSKGYFLKRKISIIKRMLRVQLDMTEKVSNTMEPQIQNHFKHLHSHLSKNFFYADELMENIQALMNLQVNIASQKTNESNNRINEITRLLTVFSVYFLPLNFIVGLYGMNFHFMPELQWQWGYPMSIIIMLITTLSLHYWTKKKGWL